MSPGRSFVLSGDPKTLDIRAGPYKGARVEVLTDVPFGVTGGIGRAMVRYGQAEAGSAIERTALQAAWAIFAADVLTGWNLYDRRGVIPVDAEAFARLSPRFIVFLLTAWADLMNGEQPDGR